MPTCISVNEIAGHYSPMQDESEKLKEGDVAKLYVKFKRIRLFQWIKLW